MIKPLALLFLFMVSCISLAQVGIGTTSPHSSSIVELKSSNKGFLPPRMNKFQIEQIESPHEGLLVYCYNCCTDGAIMVYAGDNTKWTELNSNCVNDQDKDGVNDNEDVDSDNDGITDINEQEAITIVSEDFGNSITNPSTACLRHSISGPNYSGIPYYAASGDVADGYYAMVYSGNCGAGWASSFGLDATVDPPNRYGAFMFVNAPNVAGGSGLWKKCYRAKKHNSFG